MVFIGCAISSNTYFFKLLKKLYILYTVTLNGESMRVSVANEIESQEGPRCSLGVKGYIRAGELCTWTRIANARMDGD